MSFLVVKNLTKSFICQSKYSINKQDSRTVLDNISLDIHKGESLALVGESGCGKTTFGKCILRLIPSNSGSIIFDGMDILKISENQFRPFRSNFQMIFQDPIQSLNPRQTVFSCLNEVLRFQVKKLDIRLKECAEVLRIRLIGNSLASAVHHDERNRGCFDVIERSVTFLAEDEILLELVDNAWRDFSNRLDSLKRLVRHCQALPGQTRVDPHVTRVCAVRIDVVPLIGPVPFPVW